MYGLQGFFFENCTDCTDFFENCTDFFLKCTDLFKNVRICSKKCTDCTDFFFENCMDCTDFLWKCTDFFKKVLATLQIGHWIPVCYIHNNPEAGDTCSRRRKKTEREPVLRRLRVTHLGCFLMVIVNETHRNLEKTASSVLFFGWG